MYPKASGTRITTVIVLAALGLAGLFGLALAAGQLMVLAALAALLGLLALLVLRVEQVVWLQFAAATLLGGALAYFAGVGSAQWLPIGVGAALYLLLLLRLIGMRRGQAAAPLSAPALLGAAFACVALLGTAWAGADLGQWLYGLRYYFAMGSLFFVLALLPLPAEMLRRLWLAFLAVVLLQLPVALYQYVAVAGRRIQNDVAGVAWDAVVGTMGGSQEGGGHSAAMGFFVLSGFVLTFALWKRQLLRIWQIVGFTAAVLGVIFLAEVKFMVILLPIAVALVLRLELLARIKQLLMGALVVAILAMAMPLLYSKLHYERSGRPAVGVAEFYQKLIENTDPEKFNEGTGQMGRVAQIAFWWTKHSLLEQPKEFLIGHGIAATNVARIGMGTVARRYFPLPVSNTAGVIMLWEVGVVGLGLCVAALLVLALQALRLSARAELPLFHRCALEAGAAILLMLIPALFYKHFPLKSPATQFILFLAAGQVCFWQARLAQAMKKVRKPHPRHRLRPAAMVARR
jgi:hypothetical protein